MGVKKENYHSRNNAKPDGTVKNSRIIQILLTGKTLKDFDLECAKLEDAESATGRGLIIDGLRFREVMKNQKPTKLNFFPDER